MQQYKKLTPKAVLELAAPHTWPAAVFPVLLGSLLALVMTGKFHLGLFYSTLGVCVLLQCGVNTLNDYADFIKGTDTVENSHDPTDAALVYHGFHPKKALATGLVFLLLAFGCGIYTLCLCGWQPLIYGALGGAVVLLYSFGKTPLSGLPVGEVSSGVVMGGLIPMACYYVQTGVHDPLILLLALPMIISVGLIMMMNNTSDIERDLPVGRITLPGILGRHKASLLLKVLLAGEFVILLLLGMEYFPRGMTLYPALALWMFLTVWPVWKGELTPENRIRNMIRIVQIHSCVSVCWLLVIGGGYLMENLL